MRLQGLEVLFTVILLVSCDLYLLIYFWIFLGVLRIWWRGWILSRPVIFGSGFVTSCKYIFTVRIRSFGQGNVFTRVCHSVHRGSLYDVTSCLSVSSPMFLPGRRVPLEGGSLSLVPCSFCGESPLQRPPCTVKSRWNASYWNAFLFYKLLLRLNFSTTVDCN